MHVGLGQGGCVEGFLDSKHHVETDHIPKEKTMHCAWFERTAQMRVLFRGVLNGLVDPRVVL